MTDPIFILSKVICFLAVLAIIFMVINRLRGKDEVDGLLNTKKKKKEKK